MENNYDNIEPQHQDVFNLIQNEFNNENISDEIQSMVKRKINNTDFTSFVGNSSIATIVGNSSMYILGVIVVAGALTLYYFMNSSENSTDVNNKKYSTIENNDVPPNMANGIDTKGDISENKSQSVNNKALDLADNKDKIVKKSKDSELLSLETQEYEHSQSISLHSDIEDEYVSESFNKIAKNIGFQFFDKSNKEYIELRSGVLHGKFNNDNVEFSFILKFSKVYRNKITAILKYKVVNTTNSSLDVENLFYSSLSSELRKFF